MTRLTTFALCFALSCNAGSVFAHEALPWTLDTVAERLKADSCQTIERVSDFEQLPLTIEAVKLGVGDMSDRLPSNLRFTGGWALTSSNRKMGGLSGLSIEPDGSVLTVSDMGQFIRLGRTGGELNGTAEIAPMQFENPLIRPGKLTTDAEGIAIRDGLTFVSFERDFRVMAFALDQCGAAARGILVSDPPSRYGLRPIRANAGPEALWLDTEGGLHILYEQLRDGAVTTAQATEDGKAHMAPLTPAPSLDEGFRPVGADQISLSEDRSATAFLYRAYNREQGNRIRLDITLSDQEDPFILRLAPPLLTDNFEGVAMEETDEGLRLWIISDDNFSDRQQTLLYVFDLTLTP